MTRFKPDYLLDLEPATNECSFGSDWGLPDSFAARESILAIHPASSVILPEHFESGYQYPVIVWLDGSDQAPGSLRRIPPKISERNFLGIAVRDESAFPWGGNSWRQSPESISRTSESIQAALEEAHLRFNIDLRRVFLAGTGTGGTMAFRIAFRYPQLFAGAASLEGAVPGNQQPLRNLTHSRNVPLFWAQLRDSKCLPEPVICEQLRLLYVAGFDLTLRQYPGEQSIDEVIFNDLNRWMMEQIARQPDSAVVF